MAKPGFHHRTLLLEHQAQKQCFYFLDKEVQELSVHSCPVAQEQAKALKTVEEQTVRLEILVRYYCTLTMDSLEYLTEGMLRFAWGMLG
jgi:hypothetical protein